MGQRQCWYKKEFDNEPVYNKEYLKTKINLMVITDFYDKESPNVDSNYTCIAVINFDFILKKDESYYPQVFLKECKYVEKKIIRHIHDNLSDFSSDDDNDESDEE